MTTPRQIIDTLRSEADNSTPADVLAALEDGEALGNYNWRPSEIRAAQSLLDGVRSWSEFRARLKAPQRANTDLAQQHDEYSRS
ncbi:MAG: hypothetical protein KHX35_05950 [Sutterella wadsworthensis]|nr:hypothetical protein [Sutterella wadsworthensis]